MPTALLLALASDAGGGPACLLPAGETTILSRLVHQVVGHAEVVVVTRSAWKEAVSAAVGVPKALNDVGVIAVHDRADLLRLLSNAPEGRIAMLPGDVIASDLAVGRVTDRGATRTAVLGATPDQPGVSAQGWPLRVTRGRVVAAGSHIHRVHAPTHRSLDAWCVAATDREALTAAADDVGRLLATGGLELDVSEDSLELVPPTLLVALVRRGVAVALTPLPSGAVWSRPTTRGQAASAATAAAEVDEDRVRLDAAVKAEDGFFTTFFVSTYSRYWARSAARAGVTPDQVTVASMGLGVAAAIAFAWGTTAGAVVGAVALQLAFTLDCVDGQLARYTRNFSIFGAWLDSIFDRGKEYAVYAGLAVGGVRAGGDTELWWFAAALLAMQTFRHTVDLGYVEQQRRDLAREVRRPLTVVGESGTGFWEPAPAVPVATLPQRVIGWLRRAEAVPALKWLKRIVVLPIGERFALISVLAITSGPRTVFLVLLTWGALATSYTVGGRVVRSIA